MFWAMANGHIPTLFWSDNPVWFIALFFLTPVWISFHFYWIHRFLHWPPLYRLAHALHHRNTNVGPWSGFSMHPIEHILFLSSILIQVVVAAPRNATRAPESARRGSLPKRLTAP